MVELYGALVKHLRLSDSVILVVTTGFVTHQIFKRYEPDAPLPVGVLLLAVPTLLIPFVATFAPSTFLAITFTYVWYWASVLTNVAVYRLAPWHPLAQYPGPILNKLSKLTMAWKMYEGQQHLYYQKMHEKYGDIVRVGPNELSISRADTIVPILGPSGLPKGVFWYNRAPAGSPGALITYRDRDQHKARRRLWDRAFSTASVKGYDDLIIARMRELTAQFEKRSGQIIDLSLWVSFFSFGAGFDMMQNGSDVTGVWAALDAMNIMTAVLAHIPWSFTYQRLIPGIGGPRERFLNVAKAYVSRRIQRGSVIKDLFYHLTDEAGLEPIKPTMPAVFADGALAVVAGSDTTATTLSVLFYYLLIQPEHFQRLRAEIDQFFPDKTETTDFTKMVGMPFLNACMNEALRLVPPVLDGSPRSSPDSQGCTVGPYYIPPGQQILPHFYTIHHNPDYFTDPDSFIPDRWLPSSAFASAPGVKHEISAFNPFSFGPMACVGKNLALVELRGVTCFVVQKFDLARPEGFKDGEWIRGLGDAFVVTRPPLMVKVQARSW
ncbi:hypothetical protein HWV62_12184 [Athelia sp. TMB]|nr:hypothetical protein HWV62_12184 [Athelia sp. TMB]